MNLGRILIIDDDQALLRVTKLLLAMEGFTVDAVSAAAQGLDLIESSSYDLILLDLQMPDMDGRAFFREARARGCHSRVLIVSAHGADLAYRELQADGFIAKPFDPDFLIRKVHDCLALGP